MWTLSWMLIKWLLSLSLQWCVYVMIPKCYHQHQCSRHIMLSWWKKCKSYRMGSSVVECCFLDIQFPLHSWAHHSSGHIHKTSTRWRQQEQSHYSTQHNLDTAGKQKSEENMNVEWAHAMGHPGKAGSGCLGWVWLGYTAHICETTNK